jgi:hypothetical protein
MRRFSTRSLHRFANMVTHYENAEYPKMKWLSICSFVLCLSSSFLLPASEPAGRAPLPDAAAIAGAESQFRERYEDQLAKAHRAAERRALAEKFVDEGSQPRNTPALRLVLLREARQLAVDLADADLLRRSVEAAASQFQIEAAPMRKEAFAKAAATVRTAASAGEFAAACLEFVDGAVAAEDFAAAMDYGHAAYVAAGKARDKALLDDVIARGRLVVAQQKQFQLAQEAAAKLAASPDDPQANLEMGRYLAALKKDWPRTLACLSKSSDDTWRGLAKQDLARPSQSAARLALADGWWDLAATQAEPVEASLRGRAATWYRLTLPDLRGDEKSRVVRRLAEVKGFSRAAKSSGATDVASRPTAAVESGSAGETAKGKPLVMSDNGWADLVKLIGQARPAASTGWELQGGELHVSPKGSPARLAIPVAPGGAYDLKLEFTRTDSFEMLGVVLPVGTRQCLAAINFGGGASGLDMIDGRRAGDNTSSFAGALSNDRRYTLEISVAVDGKEAAVTAKLDGRPMFFYRGPVASLALAKEWSIGGRNRLGLVSQATAVVHSFQLRATAGRAMLLELR